MKTTITYHSGMHFSGRTASGHTLHMDSGHAGEPTQGPTPMETVLQAAAVCSAMDIVAILQKRRKEIVKFELISEAERSEDHPKIFKTLKVTYRIGGAGITLEEVQKAVQLSQEKYCSVINMLKPTVQVDYQVELLAEQA
ncbi:MAG: OsmC family protein [bacterium]|nr:OsmC family protein [bacterium]